jgi:hypothetical protein
MKTGENIAIGIRPGDLNAKYLPKSLKTQIVGINPGSTTAPAIPTQNNNHIVCILCISKSRKTI